jgi:hypothetical protein
MLIIWVIGLIAQPCAESWTDDIGWWIETGLNSIHVCEFLVV